MGCRFVGQFSRRRELLHGRVQSVRPQVRVHSVFPGRVRAAVGAGRAAAGHHRRRRVAQPSSQVVIDWLHFTD